MANLPNFKKAVQVKKEKWSDHVHVNVLLMKIVALKVLYYMSRVMTKPAFCICQNKDRSALDNCAAGKRLCFRYIDSIISSPEPKAHR